ncbi:FecCD family ABC transporter permease [Anaeroselena agilis]|uniref:Iron ABC transporter permease n=1 Tax=Anaeroselena agilis TaxID=3063788 RepID=A0ABU3NSG8_9FIRM|nr:iron ABC transporter permease [Selenomonadales bacterium 4137-cl]
MATDNTPAALHKASFGPRLRVGGLALPAMALILLAVFAGSFLVGRFPVSPETVLAIVAAKIAGLPQTWPDSLETVIFKVRLPRILAAVLVGAALSLAGAAYQNLFRNPLMAPEMLGATWGAAFGAVLGMVFRQSWLAMELTAFVFGLLAVACTVCINLRFGSRHAITLVLAGIVVSAFFQSATSALKYLADPMDTLPALTFWLMGGLSKITLQDVAWTALPVAVPAAVLYRVRWRINVLSVGEEEAHTLGVDVKRTRMLVLVCATLMTAAVVSISGIIHWVGLLIPHLARMLVGADFSRVLPASMLLGGTYMLVMDNLSRSIASIEIQVGILTALIGAPFFVFLLARAKKGWA